MRSVRGKRARRFLGRILAGGAVLRVSADRRARFDGSRIGRGASRGRLLSARTAGRAGRPRRVIVKTRLVKLAGKGAGAARAHLRYIQRDGVTRDGLPGELYSAREDIADGKEFLERSAGDRHQFRLIVSPEDGDLYPDLKPFVRRLMAQVEKDLETRLEWVAVDHFNTGRPHSHILLRGTDETGANLVIAREYIAHGFRNRASEIATLDLGPVTRLEIEARMRRDIDAERLTDIDRQLLREAERAPLVSASARDSFEQSMRAGRLQKLVRLGLADEAAPGAWQLAPDMADTLRRMGERGDIIAALNRELSGRTPLPADRVIHEPGRALETPLVGRVVLRGLADELADRHYLVIDATDGRTHYVEIGKGERTEPLPEHAIVRIAPARAKVREVDRTIAAVAQANGGTYSVEAHRLHDPDAGREFVQAHVRRLEAMRRAGVVERQEDGTWTIAADHLRRVAAYEERRLKDRPVSIEVLSPMPIERLAHAEAVTWLDREALAARPEPLRDKGFGRDVRQAAAARRQWLVEQELADAAGESVVYRPGTLAALQRRELLRLARRLSDELDKSFVETPDGERVQGTLARRVDTAGGRYALVERAHEFTLVPWKPVLARHLGKEVGGTMRERGVSWTIGRGRSGPEIG